MFLPFSFGRMSCVGTVSLKGPERSLPAHQARMHQRVRVRKEALANLAGLPSVRRNVERHAYHHWRANNVFARHTTPKPAVVGIAAIVAHYEITVVPNFVRLAQIVRFGAAGSVLFRGSLAIHPHRTVVDFNGISRHADNALVVIRRSRRKTPL